MSRDISVLDHDALREITRCSSPPIEHGNESPAYIHPRDRSTLSSITSQIDTTTTPRYDPDPPEADRKSTYRA